MKSVGTQNEADRDEWLYRVIAELPAGSRVLDAGAGEQRLRERCIHLQYVAQDFAEYTANASGAGLQKDSWSYGKLDIVCDITSIPEPESSFDAILCIEVLEHVPDPVAALRELCRLLKPGGSLILTAPFCSLTHYAPHHHCTGFNRYFYEMWLPALGLRITEVAANGSYFEYVAQELWRLTGVSRRYSKPIPIWGKAAILAVLFLLRRCADWDRGSSELLCHGYHVRAEKPKSTAAQVEG